MKIGLIANLKTAKIFGGTLLNDVNVRLFLSAGGYLIYAVFADDDHEVDIIALLREAFQCDFKDLSLRVKSAGLFTFFAKKPGATPVELFPELLEAPAALRDAKSRTTRHASG
jgi:hypothetical protein